MTETAPNTPGPMLSGIKVLDLTTVVFGPYCTQIMADLGAEVTKVESPGSGDMARITAAAAVTPGMSPLFMAYNRGKRSIALDLKTSEDAAVMRALIAESDVMVVNVRGKALEKLGLGYEAVQAIKPDIIYVHCVGFGQDGPYADQPAYDDVIQAASGATSLLPRVDGNPALRFLPMLTADKVSGLHAAYATLAALFHHQRTGEGQRVEVPMLESFTSFTLSEHLGGLTFDPPIGPACFARTLEPDRQPFPTKDGHIVLIPSSHASWKMLFDLLDDPDFFADPRYEDTAFRVAAWPRLFQRLAELTPRQTTAEILKRCHAMQIPAQEARQIETVLDDPHLTATGFFRRREHPSEGSWIELAQPVKFGAMPPLDLSQPPNHDADGPAIRARLAGKPD
jgi:crotonobetainyl-CoA:carnitine CoA-transferase CaiB-like acyl-CoA transferase